jgi:hypothetical protein
MMRQPHRSKKPAFSETRKTIFLSCPKQRSGCSLRRYSIRTRQDLNRTTGAHDERTLAVSAVRSACLAFIDNAVATEHLSVDAHQRTVFAHPE